MPEYDVIVVGAGPAGSSAAKAASEKGAKTILLEEHRIIGVPSHCTGVLHSNERPDIMEEVLRSMSPRVVIRRPGEFSDLHVYAPDGKVLQTEPWPSWRWAIDRALFDQELARQAVKAGAELVLSTRVTGLIKQGERIVGVTTGSKDLPEVSGKVVIAADGIAGGVRGIAKWEGLTRPGQTNVGGITMELTGIKECSRKGGLYTGSYLNKGWFAITATGPESGIVQFMTLEEYKKVKNGDYFLSRVLKGAAPLRMDGWDQTSDLGVRFPEIVKDGLILTGSAANWRGTIISLVSGRYAGEVAAEAIREGDTTAPRLGKFIDLYEKTGLIKELYQHSSWLESRYLGNLSDEEIVLRLTGWMQKTGMTYTTSAPVLGMHGRA
jgi:digeranylgeranylglycerophospholipid reductase